MTVHFTDYICAGCKAPYSLSLNQGMVLHSFTTPCCDNLFVKKESTVANESFIPDSVEVPFQNEGGTQVQARRILSIKVIAFSIPLLIVLITGWLIFINP